jgi:hypothetical protein
MKASDLKENEIVRDWFQSRKTKLSSQKNYLLAMRFYTGFTRMSPEQLLDEAEQDEQDRVLMRKRTVKKRLMDFRDYLESRNVAPMTIKTRITGVRSFYKAYDI